MSTLLFTKADLKAGSGIFTKQLGSPIWNSLNEFKLPTVNWLALVTIPAGSVHIPPSNLPNIKVAGLAAPSTSTASQLKVTSHSEKVRLMLVMVQLRFTVLLGSIPELFTSG